MANFAASLATFLAATPMQKASTPQLRGRVRVFESTYMAPASGTAPAIADKIIWGTLPLGAVLLPHFGQVAWNTGTASCTANLGDSCVAARHLAATAITTTGVAVPSVATLIKTAVGDITTGEFVVKNVISLGAFSIGDLIAGTGIPAASYVTAVDIARKTVTFSNLALTAATATTASLAITATGHNFRASDNSANASNSYVSSYDDATLISVIAGAQVANNQIIRVTMPYVMD